MYFNQFEILYVITHFEIISSAKKGKKKEKLNRAQKMLNVGSSKPGVGGT